MAKKIRCCMKASPFYYSQIADKVDRLKRLYEEGINSSKKAAIELHIIDLMNPEFRKKSIENCLAHKAEYAVHAQVLLAPEHSIQFCYEIGARRIIIHRFYDLNTRIEATQRFNEYMINLAESNPKIQFCIENAGFFRLISPEHFFLRDKIKRDYLVNPLNHFFPWEIVDFVGATENVKNLGICLDTAHAAISSNIFNYLKTGRMQERFSDVTKHKLQQADRLQPIDFLKATGNKLFHCHFNDAYIYQRGSLEERYVVEEGMQIGDGEISFADMVKLIDHNKVWFVAELSKVKDYSNAVEMEKACRKLFALCNGEELRCSK